ncbi:MAG: hypothetical protein LBV17_10460, partial [Treponema sp.]|nr:hypothetical protein [Treponema sp.]
NYIGEFYIIEDKKKYQEPDIKAFENFGVYEYRLNGNEIKVKDIKIFERQKIELSYDWVEPIKDDKIFTKWENSKILKIIVIENKSLSCFLCK